MTALDTARGRITGVLGAVTMYRMVLVWLGVIHVAAWAFTLAGVITPAGAAGVSGVPPVLALVLSTAVVVVCTVGTSVLFGLAVRRPTHLESSIITGLILAIVLPAATEPVGWAVLALAGAIAGGSKYLLAIRGRHLANPAAVAATIVTATGLTFNGWWAGTPVLAPFVVVGGLLIALRTQRLGMVALFVLLAGGVSWARYLSFGAAPLDALGTALIASPVLFVAGFMLTEPLTLPPRDWQRLLYAGVVGALSGALLSIGPVFVSFQLALVIGNVLAFLVGQRRGVRLELLRTERMTPTSWRLDFRPRRPVSFAPGQYLELTLPHRGTDAKGQRRVFSIASARGADEPISIGVRASDPPSSFKRALLALEPGTTVHATLVGGDFTLPDPREKVLLAAGGIGITPFASGIADDLAHGVARDAVLVYAVSDPEEIAFRDLLERAGTRVVLVAPSAPTALPDNWTFVAGRLDAELVRAVVPDAAERHAFVSGPPRLVASLTRDLRALGVRRVVKDDFTGY
ncbi:MAG: hypothetical protein J0G30_05120 [Actinomycetales bacterium]|nr:hypothetical protein [Actinomycetales bacterium]